MDFAGAGNPRNWNTKGYRIRFAADVEPVLGWFGPVDVCCKYSENLWYLLHLDTSAELDCNHQDFVWQFSVVSDHVSPLWTTDPEMREWTEFWDMMGYDDEILQKNDQTRTVMALTSLNKKFLFWWSTNNSVFVFCTKPTSKKERTRNCCLSNCESHIEEK